MLEVVFCIQKRTRSRWRGLTAGIEENCKIQDCLVPGVSVKIAA